MNQKSQIIRITVILYILSFTISLFIFYGIMSSKSIDFEYTSYATTAVEGSDIYYAQNTTKGGVVLRLDTKGNVQNMLLTKELEYERVRAVTNYDNSVYAVLSNYQNIEDESNENAYIPKEIFCVLRLDRDLEIITATPDFELEDGMIFKSISVEKNGIYLSAISKNGENAVVYHMDTNQLMDFLAEDLPQARLETIRTKKAADGRFYADSFYKDGQLYIRTDADEPVGIFGYDKYIKEVVSKIKLSTIQLCRLYDTDLIEYIAVLLIWFILLYLIIRAVVRRNRTFYFLMVAEAVLFVITAAGAIAVVNNYYRAKTVEHSRFAIISLLGLADDAGLKEVIDYSDGSVYDTNRYQEIKDSICEFARRDGNSSIFYDVFVYSLLDETVCASASGRNREPLSDIYGQNLSSIVTDLYRGDSFTTCDFVIEGEEYRAVAIEVAENTPKFALVGIINATTLDKSVVVNNKGTFLLFLMVFTLGSALVINIFRLYLRDMTSLESALSVAASGGKFPERPARVGSDVKEMWDSVTEINKKLEENEYIKIRILEAYYRFAPKNVERVLFKNSILEVKNGNASNINGTVAIMGIDNDGVVPDKIDAILGSIGEYQKDHDCMIVGKAPDISRLQMFFMETDSEIIKFMIELYTQNLKIVNSAMFSTVLYFDRCKFSVMGSNEEATTYLRSDNQNLLKRMVGFVSKCKLGLVVAEDVKNRENLKIPYRFIGYSRRDLDGVGIKLFEVLDVYPASVRAQRLNTLQRYNEALQCFYEMDFYIARTKFSDILKETPDDELVRWYVFESERYLNEIADGDTYKFLHL